MLTRATLEEFDAVYRLLSDAFPREERRDAAGQRALLSVAEYRLLLQKDAAGEILAVAAVWELPQWTFLEHLAVIPAARNGGLGSAVLQELRKRSPSPIVLEVEPPDTPLACRRIGFYQRNGFFLNEYPYRQPALGTDRISIPLLLMTTGRALSPVEFTALRELLYRQVYHVSEGEDPLC